MTSIQRKASSVVTESRPLVEMREPWLSAAQSRKSNKFVTFSAVEESSLQPHRLRRLPKALLNWELPHPFRLTQKPEQPSLQIPSPPPRSRRLLQPLPPHSILRDPCVMRRLAAIRPVPCARSTPNPTTSFVLESSAWCSFAGICSLCLWTWRSSCQKIRQTCDWAP